jgi:protein phosphatase
VGLPGSGKSTWAHGKSGVLSSDAVRALLLDDATDQTQHRRVFRTLRELLKQRLELGRPVTYIDATNLEPWERRPYIVLAELYDAVAEAIFFDTPLEECRRRNRERERIVPDEALTAMASRLVHPSESEGFLAIRTISSAIRE